MNDRIQSQPPRPNPPSNEDEHYAVNLRKPPSGIPVWVWVIVGAVLLLPVGCMSAGALVYFLKVTDQPPRKMTAATARAVPAPLPAPQPDDR